MYKRLVTTLILTFFSVSILSCYSTKMITIEQFKARKNKKGAVLEVMKKSREWIEFSKDNPGKVVGDAVVCKIWELSEKKRVKISIPLSEIRYLKIRRFAIKISKTLLAFMLAPVLIPIVLWLVNANGN